jgi:hypothetical protein
MVPSAALLDWHYAGLEGSTHTGYQQTIVPDPLPCAKTTP